MVSAFSFSPVKLFCTCFRCTVSEKLGSMPNNRKQIVIYLRDEVLQNIWTNRGYRIRIKKRNESTSVHTHCRRLITSLDILLACFMKQSPADRPFTAKLRTEAGYLIYRLRGEQEHSRKISRSARYAPTHGTHLPAYEVASMNVENRSFL